VAGKGSRKPHPPNTILTAPYTNSYVPGVSKPWFPKDDGTPRVKYEFLCILPVGRKGSTGDNLYDIIKGVHRERRIPATAFVASCTDHAKNMVGPKLGVSTQLVRDSPGAVLGFIVLSVDSISFFYFLSV
jgi:hypothetical protein